MAEQVARLKILAQIEGLEGFDKLKGAFKGLQQAIGPSDQQLSKARKEILAFGKAGEQTEQSLLGQVEALKALQGQASTSGAVYKQLGRDIRELGGAYKEASTGVKQFTDAQLKSQIVGSKPETFDKQIAALRRSLQDLKVYSREYTDVLTEIQRRQLPFNTALGRQNVIAGFEAYQQGGKGGSALPELPNTTAGLQQRLIELNQEFVNLTRGGERWIAVSREIASVQRQVNQEFANPAVEAARERLEASRNTSSGFLAFSSGLEDRMAIQKSIARNQRKRGPAAIELPMMETSELYRSIQAVGLSRIAQQNELMGNSYAQVARDIKGATAASDGSLNSLRSQRQAWESLRNAVNSSGAEFKEASREIAKLDRQLDRAQGGGNKLGQRLQAFGAIASGGIFGGVEGLVGGIGGAALGSVVPGLGTVGGAFAGAAIGGSVSMLRQQVAATAEYAATVGRLNIALKELTGTQQDYADAQQVIRRVTLELNVPTLEATQGFTKLLASVKGAGGNVRDAEIVFRGVTEAIKATGGTSEDVQGALTAMSQVFSKGKVSAEELSGQLGERLPGAFTRFAAATGRTGAELSKALEQGTVGLNDVMKFSMALSEQNSATALKMAKSQEDSTARMKVALADLQAAFGSAVMPITSAVSGIIASVAELATRTLKALGLVKDALNEMSAAGREADLSQRLKDANQPLGLQSFGPLRRQGYSNAEISEFRKRALALEKAITPQTSKAGLEQNLRYLEEVRELLRKAPASGLSAKQIDAFEADQKRITGRIDETRAAIERLKQTQNKSAQELTNFANPKDDKAGGADKAAKDAERLAADQQRLDEANAQAQIRLAESVFRAQVDFDRKRFELQQELIDKEHQLRIAALTGVAAETASATAQFFRSIDELRRRSVEAGQSVAAAQQGLVGARMMQSVTGGGASGIIARTGNTGQSTGAHLDLRWGDGRPITKADADKYFLVNGQAPSSFGVTSPYGPRSLFGRSFHGGIDFGTPAGSAISLKGGATLSRDLGNTGAGGYAIEVMTPEGTMKALHLMAGSVARNQATGLAAQQRRNAADQGDTAIAQIDVQAAQDYKNLLEEMTQKRLPQEVQLFALEGAKAYRDQTQALKDNVAELQLRQTLELSGARQEVIDSELQKLRLGQQYTRQIAELNYQLQQKEVQEDPIKAEGIRGRLTAITDAYKTQTLAINEATAAQIAFNDAMRFRQDMRIGAGLQEGAQQYVQSIGTMKDATAQLAQTGIKGVEDAIFSLVTTGRANFAEFAAAILRDTARMIIQQMILRTIMQAIGALGGGGGGGGGGLFNPAAFSMPSLLGSANGNAFGPRGVIPFAMGGIVNQPTLFKFANGGAGRLGLMGEAGPEAIIPLRRGRDGKLGVAGGGGTTNVTVNVDASGSNVQGDNGQAAALGRAVSQAVQQELIRQRRPGGLLAA